jgi:hypothetical protein
MSKKAIGFIIVIISLAMVAPLSARGPKGGKNGQSLATLTQSEIDSIIYMREEEKLARDVYQTLFDEYGTSIFENIRNSEQRHMDALKNLIIKYGLEDPVQNDTVGEFNNPVFSELYEDLVAAGTESYCGALQVGIDIEELDIADIQDALNGDEVIAPIEAPDVIRVLNNLLSGSWNHLNAFTSQSDANNCDVE